MDADNDGDSDKEEKEDEIISVDNKGNYFLIIFKIVTQLVVTWLVNKTDAIH